MFDRVSRGRRAVPLPDVIRATTINPAAAALVAWPSNGGS
jgi:hypothetical protein